MALPSIVITGNLTQDVELRFTQNGKAFAIIRTASSERKKDEHGNWVNGDVTYLSSLIWGEPAEAATNFLRKGDPVVITGKLRSKEYTTQQGEKRQSYEVSAETVAKNMRPNKVNNAPAINNLINGGLVAEPDAWTTTAF